MKQLKELYQDILDNGVLRDTRSGKVVSKWDAKLSWDLSKGFPATTSKKLAHKAVVGELLWFLSGETDLCTLRKYTFGEDVGQRTIWTDDAERWWKNRIEAYPDLAEPMKELIKAKQPLGNLYGRQWRGAGVYKPDQIKNLIERLVVDPSRRDHIVMAWNAADIEENTMALKPCHLGFQCYVDDEKKLHLKWWQRSWDVFLGAPFNIASYALLQHLLASWCGLEVGTLTVDAGDVHIYENHLEAVNQYIENKEHPLPKLVLPKQATISLEECLKLSAIDFEEMLVNYEHEGVIKAPLSVGV